jgi:uncharacterized protein YqhQ
MSNHEKTSHNDEVTEKTKSNNNQNQTNDCCKGNNKGKQKLDTAGGQAVLEGVMMKTKNNYAIAVRKESGEIVIKQKKSKSIRDKIKFLNWPFIRGPINMVESLASSFKTLEESAEMAGIEFDEEPSKFERWLEKKFGKSIIGVITVIAGILGVALSLFLFMYLPSLLASGVEFIVEKLPWRGNLRAWMFNVIEGIFKIVIFIIYIALSSKLNDIKRVYQYHGAEHKTIFCYEKKQELTIENVKKQKRFHPRCGTSFIFVILIISIFVMTCATTIINHFKFFDVSNRLIRTLLKLLLLPITVSIGYEFIRYAGKHDNLFTKILSAPGLWMQRITTKEPDESMIEVAIVSLKAALPDEYPVIEELEKQAEKFSHKETESETESQSDSQDSTKQVTDSQDSTNQPLESEDSINKSKDTNNSGD